MYKCSGVYFGVDQDLGRRPNERKWIDYIIPSAHASEAYKENLESANNCFIGLDSIRKEKENYARVAMLSGVITTFFGLLAPAFPPLAGISLTITMVETFVSSALAMIHAGKITDKLMACAGSIYFPLIADAPSEVVIRKINFPSSSRGKAFLAPGISADVEADIPLGQFFHPHVDKTGALYEIMEESRRNFSDPRYRKLIAGGVVTTFSTVIGGLVGNFSLTGPALLITRFIQDKVIGTGIDLTFTNYSKEFDNESTYTLSDNFSVTAISDNFKSSATITYTNGNRTIKLSGQSKNVSKATLAYRPERILANKSKINFADLSFVMEILAPCDGEVIRKLPSGGLASKNVRINGNALLELGSVACGSSSITGPRDGSVLTISGDSLIDDSVLNGKGDISNSRIEAGSTLTNCFTLTDTIMKASKVDGASISGSVVNNSEFNTDNTPKGENCSAVIVNEAKVDNSRLIFDYNDAIPNQPKFTSTNGNVTLARAWIKNSSISATQGGAIRLSLSGRPSGAGFNLLQSHISTFGKIYASGTPVLIGSGITSGSNSQLELLGSIGFNNTSMGHSGVGYISQGQFISSTISGNLKMSLSNVSNSIINSNLGSITGNITSSNCDITAIKGNIQNVTCSSSGVRSNNGHIFGLFHNSRIDVGGSIFGPIVNTDAYIGTYVGNLVGPISDTTCVAPLGVLQCYAPEE